MSAYGPDARRRRLDMARRRCQTLTEARVVDYLGALERTHERVSPSRAQIATAVGKCERSVTRATGALERRGVLGIWRDPPHRRSDGTYTRARTNLYRLRWAKRQVAPRGHMRHTNAALRSSSTGGPPASPPPVPPTAPPLPLNDDLPPPEPAPEAPTAPPWVRRGITRAQWLAEVTRGA